MKPKTLCEIFMKEEQMKANTITITRESELIFKALGDFPFWSDGNPVSARLAFDASGVLSAVRAQSIDRAHGNRYILLAPFSIKNHAVIETAKGLSVGDQATVAI